VINVVKLKRPEAIKNRIDINLDIDIQSFNQLRLNSFLDDLHKLIKGWQNKQVTTKIENYVWVTVRRWAK